MINMYTNPNKFSIFCSAVVNANSPDSGVKPLEVPITAKDDASLNIEFTTNSSEQKTPERSPANEYLYNTPSSFLD